MAKWNIRAFRGNPYITVSAITMGTIAAARTSATGVPAVFHLSASAVTATGTSQPFEDLEYSWEVTSGAELGDHTFTLAWRIPYVAGTPQSITVDSHTDQIGPEAAFRFFLPGTKTITLTARGSDGAGGYITNTATIDLTVTAHTNLVHFWYDADAGNNANDGKDPWGFAVTTGTLSGANVAVGLYEIVSKDSNDQLTIRIAAGDDRTLTKTGAFASYDHAAAIAPEFLCRYNWIYLTAGTAAGGISTSTGPRQNNPGTTVAAADNRSFHFKGGNTTNHTLPSTSNLRNRSGLRFLAYGASKAKTGMISYGLAAATETSIDHCWHRFLSDRADAASSICFQISAGTAAGSCGNYVGLSDCTLQNCLSKAINSTGTGNNALLGLFFWGCDLDQPNGDESGAFVRMDQWLSFVGGSVTGTALDDTLDHHIYPALRGHFLCKWVTFGSGVGRNYCINTDAAGDDGVTRDYWNINECFLTGTLRAWDASHGGGSENCWLRNMVCEGNVITGLTGSGQVLFYHCYSMVLRDNIIYGNTGGRFFDPDPAQTTSDFKIYHNQWYTAMASGHPLCYLYSQIPLCLFRNNTIRDDRTTDNESLQCDFSQHDVQDNVIYSPNNAGIVVFNNAGGGLSGRTFAQFVAECDATATNADPGWIDPASGDFTIAEEASALTAVTARAVRAVRGGRTSRA